MKSRFIHTSASASHDFYPSDIKVFAVSPVHAAPGFLGPQKDLAIIIIIPFSVPNSVPDYVQSFSLNLSLRHALPISHANISRAFKGATINKISTISPNTTLERVINYDDGAVL